MKLNFPNCLSNTLVFREIIQSKTVINEENSKLNFRNSTQFHNKLKPKKKLFSILTLLICRETHIIAKNQFPKPNYRSNQKYSFR